MRLRDDFERLREVGGERREDLKEFISYDDLSASRLKDIKIPIKVVDLPGFRYDRLDMGGVGQEKGDTFNVGQPFGQPELGDGEGEDGDPDEEGAEHKYYEMDPEQFTEALDEELGPGLEPKGEEVIGRTEGDSTDITRSGPHNTLDLEHLFKEGLEHKLAVDFDEEFVREAMRIEGTTVREVFEWCHEDNIFVSMAWIEDEWSRIPDDEHGAQASSTEMEESVKRTTAIQRTRREGLREIPFRREDERYRHPEVIEKEQSSVVVINIRDVSELTRETKCELVERAFTSLDWYLTGKYDHTESAYVAHSAEAREVERDGFFGIRSGGRMRVSSACELAEGALSERYPWHEWNRYVFAMGDSKNSSNDTKERVVPLIWRIDANLHAYVEAQPDGTVINVTHAGEVEQNLGEQGNVVVAYTSEPDDVIDAIYTVLSTEVTAE